LKFTTAFAVAGMATAAAAIGAAAINGSIAAFIGSLRAEM
jgi:hypothetical protein